MSVSYFKSCLPNFDLPLTRAAYSDRTAWIMAEMSALAYFKFEGPKTLQEEINDITYGIKAAYRIKSFFSKKKHSDVLKKIESLEKRLKKYIDDKTLEKKFLPPGKVGLQKHLKGAGFKLIEIFDLNDTQAFLAKRETDKIAVLAFRGTEANKSRDVETDINAWTINSGDGTKIHAGFANAYEHVKSEIQEHVSKSCPRYSLYITGHSLGGALAIIAAKELEKTEISIAACYTFGSPRVGNEELGEKIKAPVYRVVNAADLVPRIPPRWIVIGLIFFFRLILWRKIADYIEKNFSDYTHYGDMRYLTACNASMENLKLLENPSLPDRLVKLCRRVIAKGPRITAKDHRIIHYRDKLRHYAERHNKAPDKLPV